MARQLRCRTCRNKFTPARGTNRVNCYTCRPSRLRTPAAADVVSLPVAEPTERGELETATFAELAGRGRQSTTAGVLALTIARSIDHGGHTGSQVAALAARLLDAAAVALKGAPKAADGVDELQEMRKRIRGA